MSRRVGMAESVTNWHADQRAAYGAARDNRLRRRRITPSMGAPGDYHLPGNDFLKIMEYARAMDRDDAILGSVLDRAEINTIQGGFTLDFDTGDITLDEELLGGWCEWSEDPDRCDVAGEMCFAEMESMAFRSSRVDGDIWALLTDGGQIQWFEADRLRTPSGLENRHIVQGVELDAARRQMAVWLTPAQVGPRIYDFKTTELYKVPVRDDDGLRRMLQIFAGPKRPTLTRGLSVYQKLFDLAGMHDDTQFAALLKQQLQNAVIFTEKLLPGDYGPPTRFGPTETPGEQVPAGNSIVTTEVQGVGAGVAVSAANGRELSPSRNTAPGPDFVGHVKMILTLMGVNLGMPLVLVLMDAKETNFSGWRGAFDQAKMGFRRNQRRELQRFNEPVLKWHLALRQQKDSRLMAAMDRIVRKAKAAGKQWYKWHLPTFPYVNPMDDASANLIAVANYQEAPSTNMAKQGLDHDRENTRGIEDRLYCMRKAATAAADFNKEFPDAAPKATWQDFYTPLAPKHVSMSMSTQRLVDEPPVQTGATQNGA